MEVDNEKQNQAEQNIFVVVPFSFFPSGAN